MPLVKCAVVENMEETGDGTRLDVSLLRSLAIGEVVLIPASGKSFVIEGILSGDEPITEAGPGTTVAILIRAPLCFFRKNIILYKKIGVAIAAKGDS